jgi:hypothetical protein
MELSFDFIAVSVVLPVLDVGVGVNMGIFMDMLWVVKGLGLEVSMGVVKALQGLWSVIVLTPLTKDDTAIIFIHCQLQSYRSGVGDSRERPTYQQYPNTSARSSRSSSRCYCQKKKVRCSISRQGWSP